MSANTNEHDIQQDIAEAPASSTRAARKRFVYSVNKSTPDEILTRIENGVAENGTFSEFVNSLLDNDKEDYDSSIPREIDSASEVSITGTQLEDIDTRFREIVTTSQGKILTAINESTTSSSADNDDIRQLIESVIDTRDNEMKMIQDIQRDVKTLMNKSISQCPVEPVKSEEDNHDAHKSHVPELPAFPAPHGTKAFSNQIVESDSRVPAENSSNGGAELANGNRLKTFSSRFSQPVAPQDDENHVKNESQDNDGISSDKPEKMSKENVSPGKAKTTITKNDDDADDVETVSRNTMISDVRNRSVGEYDDATILGLSMLFA